MLEQKDFEAISKTIGVAAEKMRDAINSFDNAVHTEGTEGEYIPLVQRLSIESDPPDKSVGFTFVGNDTWLPTHLVNARSHQRRKVSRMPESGIVWTG